MEAVQAMLYTQFCSVLAEGPLAEKLKGLKFNPGSASQEVYMGKGWAFSFTQKDHVLKNRCTYRTTFTWRGTYLFSNLFRGTTGALVLWSTASSPDRPACH